MSKPREVAYNLIFDWEKKKTFPNLSLKNALRHISDERDRRFITALVYGVIERKITLDHFISKCAQRPLNAISTQALTALRIGIYQMFYMDIPQSAACSTGVDLAKKHGGTRCGGFVNAVLRNAAREKDDLLLLKKADYSVRFSVEPAIVDLLLEQYGKDGFLSIMDGLHGDSSLYIYHNIKRGAAEAFIEKMNAEGHVLYSTDLPNLYRCERYFAIERSGAYTDGWFHVVGHHSAEAAALIPENSSIGMDLCAAPGGKTFILASLSNGTIHSFDIHPHKTTLLENGAVRLGHKNIRVHCADSAELIEEFIDTADFVLCDVPCSGLGIMGKKPDIKYKTYNSVEFTDLQYRILHNASLYLRRGGRLVYSTCTIDRRENEDQIARFLREHNDFEADESFYSNGIKLYLPQNGEDGFFIAVLRKG